MLNNESGKYQGPPTPITTPATTPALPSQHHTSPGRTHQNHSLHCPPPVPPAAPTQTTDPMVQMLLHKMQAQQHPMHLMMSRQATRTTQPPIDIPCDNMYFPKWESKVSFGVYRSWVDAFFANTFIFLVDMIATDLGCATSSHSLFSSKKLSTYVLI